MIDHTTIDEIKRKMREEFGIDVDRIQIHQPVHTLRLVFAIASFDWSPVAVDVLQIQNTYDELFNPVVNNRSDIQLHASYRKPGSSHSCFFRPNVINWKRLISESPASIFLMHIGPTITETFKSPEVATLAAIIGDDPMEAHSIQAHISIDDLLGNQMSASYQTMVVNRVKHLYQHINGVNGFIAIDDRMTATSVGLDTPMEREAGLTYYRSSPAFRERLRGYFWGNFLSRRHVEILGGERTLQTAPAEIIEELGNGSYYLQVSGDINNANEEQMQKLKRFLTPVLPKG